MTDHGLELELLRSKTSQEKAVTIAVDRQHNPRAFCRAGGAQRRRLALLPNGLPAGAGKGAHELGVRAVEALAGNLVAKLDGS
jgi:hypothetical protein